MTTADVVRLGPAEALSVATLLAAHLHEQRGGEPPRPDRYHAERLLCEDGLVLIGARLDRELVGIAVVHELTDSLTGAPLGLIETVFVRPERRGRGVGRSLLDGVGDLGRRRMWSRIGRVAEVANRFTAMRDPSADGPRATTSRVIPLARQ